MSDNHHDPRIDRRADDPRSDLEQAVQSRRDTAEATDARAPTTPLEPTGVPDGVGGTAGEVKNQNKAQQ